MATCNDCLHSGICAIQLETHYVLDRTQKLMRESNNVEHECLSFKDRSRFVKLKSAVWCKHKPELSKMEKFHKQGIGLGMSENSVFWTCSNCGVWGSPIYSFCPHCGARITKEREENA